MLPQSQIDLRRTRVAIFIYEMEGACLGLPYTPGAGRTLRERRRGGGPVWARAPPPFVSLTDWPVHIRGAWGWSPRFPTPAEFLKASHWFTQLVAAWRTTPFPCNALLAPRVLDMSRAWHADRARSCWRAQPVELKRYEGCGSDANRGARGGPGANNMALQ
jgi:hypothetical protein